jgi:hypothetical protein
MTMTLGIPRREPKQHLARRVKRRRVHRALVWRVRRRGLILVLGGSLATSVGLLMGALGHRFASHTGLPERLALGHVAVEVFLWVGAILALGTFLVAAIGFRREVQVEKAARRRKKERRELVRLVRRYATDENGRLNN